MIKKIKPKKKPILSDSSLYQKVSEDFNGNVSKAARELNIPRRTLRRILAKPTNKSSNVKRFVITYAQNNTLVSQGFFDAIQVFISVNPSELICYKGLYKNPTQPKEEIEDVWYDPKIRPYLMDTERLLNSNVTIFPARTQPTAVNPLSGYDTHTGHKSGIFPHPKIRLKTVATPGHKMPKVLCSTGAITEKNYSKSKAGEKAKHHHIFGACIVEVVDDKIFHLRHINASEDGSFYDIAGDNVTLYTATGVHTNQRISELTKGDIHHPWINEKTWEGGIRLIKKHKPKRIFLHDLIDFWRQNHHEMKNIFLTLAKQKNNQICVREEMRQAAEFLVNLRDLTMADLYIVKSNHDEALDRWLNEGSINKLGENVEYFMELFLAKTKSATPTYNGFRFRNMLEYALGEFIKDKSRLHFLDVDQSVIFNDIEYGMHGHYGPNGARGSTQSFSKIGVKSNTAHGHSPEIIDGAYRAGVNCNHLGYAKGPSGWIDADIVTYLNGKRTLLIYVDGEYCL